MTLKIQHQESYSRGELLLRTFFGFIYIGIPHGFLLMFMLLWGGILTFVAFWSILFTGKHPEGMFQYQVKLMKWQTRVAARLFNLVDGYPAFGLDGEDDKTSVELEYPEEMSRGLAVVRAMFGVFYVYIPHGFILYFRLIATGVLSAIAWWAILFTGNYPEGMHNFNVGTFRWAYRVSAYMLFLTDTYPPFSGKPADELNK